MPLAFALVVVLFALAVDLLWLPALVCAVAAMQWTASLHPADPLAPLYAFLVAAFTARLTLAVAAQLLWLKRS
ncbi:MAG TPA: hypothetical protein VG735_05950 [Caulobacterales bacterium]|nr:hypothetical protein [Caulobacterales bacterium]